MTQPKQTILKCNDAVLPSFTTAYKTGNRPAISALTIHGTFSHGNTVSIKTNGAYNFGTAFPTLVFKSDFMGTSAGSRWTPADMLGAGTTSFGGALYPQVTTNAAMPYGKSIKWGTSEAYATNNNSVAEDAKLNIVFPAATSKVYMHYAMHFPTANQTASKAVLDAAGVDPFWQNKEMWLLDGNGADADVNRVDSYCQSFLYSGASRQWSAGTDLNSNDGAPLNVVGRGYNYVLSGSGNKLVNSAPLIQQRYYKFGTTNADVRIRNTVLGSGVNNTYNLPSGNQSGTNYSIGSSVTVDRVNVLGFIRGFNIPDGFNLELGDIYIATGAGAPFRVEITDSATYASSTKISPCIITSGSSTELLVTVTAGAFYGASLTGKYVHITDANGDYLCGGVIS